VSPPTPEELRWIEQWRSAGPELAAVRRRELALLTDEQARVAALELLAIAAALPIDPLRLTTSGLIEQQALLHGRR